MIIDLSMDVFAEILGMMRGEQPKYAHTSNHCFKLFLVRQDGTLYF